MVFETYNPNLREEDFINNNDYLRRDISLIFVNMRVNFLDNDIGLI